MEGTGARGGLTVAQYDIDVAGRIHRVAVARSGSGYEVTVDGRTVHVDAARVGGQVWSLIVGSRSIEAAVAADAASSAIAVTISGTPFRVAVDGRRRRARSEDSGAPGGPQPIAAPMPGKVVRVLVGKGDSVRARQPLVVVEAMKMENELRAPRDGTVAAVQVREGQSVDAGAVLLVVQS